MTFHSGVNCFKPSSWNTFHPHCRPAESNPPAPKSALTRSCLKSKNKSSPPLLSCSRPKTFFISQDYSRNRGKVHVVCCRGGTTCRHDINSSIYVWPRYRPLCLNANRGCVICSKYFIMNVSQDWISAVVDSVLSCLSWTTTPKA